jgi:hypothetical protein
MKLSTADYEAWMASPLTKALKQSHQNEIDAIVKDSDKAFDLLRQAETEMRYAGWGKYENDNPQRFELFKSIEAFLK